MARWISLLGIDMDEAAEMYRRYEPSAEDE
jgi:hypothetical protein